MNLYFFFVWLSAFLITGFCGYGGVCFWSWKWHIAHRMSENLESAVCALCLCSGMNMRGCLMGPLSPSFRAHDPPLFIYFILGPACWVKRELKLWELWLGDEGLSDHTDTRIWTLTHVHTGSPVCLSETGNIPNSIRAHSIRAHIGCDSHWDPSPLSLIVFSFILFLFTTLFLVMHQATDTITVKHCKKETC